MNAVLIVTVRTKKSMLACSQMSATVKSILLTQKAYVPPSWLQQVKIVLNNHNTDTLCPTKGQLISKAIYGVLDSPKKRTKKI